MVINQKDALRYKTLAVCYLDENGGHVRMFGWDDLVNQAAGMDLVFKEHPNILDMDVHFANKNPRSSRRNSSQEEKE